MVNIDETEHLGVIHVNARGPGCSKDKNKHGPKDVLSVQKDPWVRKR